MYIPDLAMVKYAILGDPSNTYRHCWNSSSLATSILVNWSVFFQVSHNTGEVQRIQGKPVAIFAVFIIFINTEYI